ncbi:MAG TPA: tRNA 4-thiouridine(8) synthase ThiI [Verrucomicrobia bacterium]|nr:tRNA 4-thiouridine(8) synthase ThiI [Verrucomicrobiota bacterium]
MGMTDGTGALGLLSGGLDSQLAVRVLQQQGIAVRTIVFDSPFYDVSAAIKAASALQVPLRIYDFTDDIIALVQNPPHGLGKCMNPCIDCHARMLRRAGELLAAEGCRFLFTGEVLNERPMSQTRRAMGIVAEESEYADLVLRPLSAKLLPPTKPEIAGWVDRMQLLELNGRRRSEQFALAKAYGLQSYPSPAGGCLLTEPNFCVRLKELRQHEGLDDRRLVRLLRVGRHFRLSTGHKCIVGRDEADNAKLSAQRAAEDVELILPDDRPGPTGMLVGPAPEQALREAAAITTFYAKCPPGEPAALVVRQDGRPPFALTVQPFTANEAEACSIRLA